MLKPSELFGSVSDVAEAIDESIDDTETTLEEDISQSVSLIDGAFKNIQEQILTSNRKELSSYKDQVLEVYNLVTDLSENQLPKYKKMILQTDLRTEGRIKDLKNELYEVLEERIEETKETIQVFFREEVKELKNLRASVVVVEKYIKDNASDIIALREEVFQEIKKLDNEVDQIVIQEKLDEIEKGYQNLSEGLLNIPPDVDNSDPLTPLDQNFVTLDQLQAHYKLFVNRVQQQLATFGGGGEVRLEFLDDIDRDTALINGRVLQYDASAGIWTGGVGGGSDVRFLSELTNDVGFVTNRIVGDFEVTGQVTVGGTFLKQTVTDIDSIGIITARSGINALGVVTATSFSGDGSNLTGLSTQLSQLTNDVGFVSTSQASTNQLLIHDGSGVSGIGSTNYANFVTDCSQGYYAYTTDFYTVGVANTFQELTEDTWNLLMPQVAATYNHQTHQMQTANGGNPWIGAGATVGTGQTEFSLAGMGDGANCLVRVAFRYTPDVDDSDMDIRLKFTTNTATQGTGLTNFSITKQALVITQGADEVYPGEILIPFFVGNTLSGMSTTTAGCFSIEVNPSDDGELEMLAVTVMVDN